MTPRGGKRALAEPEVDIDELLSHTLPPRNHPRPRSRAARRQIPPIIASWREPGRFKRWAASPVAAYRIGLMLSYLAMMSVGAAAIAYGVPLFDRTTPDGWTGAWGVVVIISGLVAAIGSIRAGAGVQAGTSPSETRAFNRIELAGAIGLFLALGTLAAMFLILAYGLDYKEDVIRGFAFTALGVQPAIRLVWLMFSPPASMTQRDVTLRLSSGTGPTPIASAKKE